MMKIEQSGKLDKWIDANLKWIKDAFGEENVVSCVLLDEQRQEKEAAVQVADARTREQEALAELEKALAEARLKAQQCR